MGGDGGNGEGPQFNVSGAENWNVTVYGGKSLQYTVKGYS
jgi:hypothetical protein